MKSVVIEKPNEIHLVERDVPEPGAKRSDDPGHGEWDLRH